MQATVGNAENQRRGLREKVVMDLMVDKRRLVEVPYTASLAHTMNALVANGVGAVPVAAPPGHWIGAGGSMIMESDKRTGVIRKHYIGMVTMLDILAHIGEDGDDDDSGGGACGGREHDLDRKMAVSVSSIIGHHAEGLTLWTLNPNTSILDCMEIFSKGIHRALVPVSGQTESSGGGVELVESASSYRMVTQTDLVKFLFQKENESELQPILTRSIMEMKAMNENVYCITDKTTVIGAIKSMRSAFLNAVPIVQSTLTGSGENARQLVNGRGRKVVGTFSATDLRGCHLTTLQSWLHRTALDFTEFVQKSLPLTADPEASATRKLVTCRPESSMAELIDRIVNKHVHRIWVTDDHGLLVGIVSLTDVIRIIRLSFLSRTLLH